MGLFTRPMSTPTGAISSRRRRLSPHAQREQMAFYLFVAPTVLGMVLFHAGPVLASGAISLTDWSFTAPPRFVGLENYRHLVLEDPLFWKILFNTVYYSFVSVPLNLLVALLVALLMNQRLLGITWFRTIYYLPAVVSGVAVALLWMWIFNPEFGLLNFFLGVFGIDGPAWLWSEEWAMPAFIMMSIWGIGTQMVILLAARQGIPVHLYEAAKVDGATFWDEFWIITLPMMSPAIFLVMVISLIGSLQIFTQTYVMTQGGPNFATATIVYYVYMNGFEFFKMGYASALAWILFLIILLLTIAQFRVATHWVYYEGAQRGEA